MFIEGQQEGAVWRQKCSAAQLCQRQYPAYNGGGILKIAPLEKLGKSVHEISHTIFLRLHVNPQLSQKLKEKSSSHIN